MGRPMTLLGFRSVDSLGKDKQLRSIQIAERVAIHGEFDLVILSTSTIELRQLDRPDQPAEYSSARGIAPKMGLHFQSISRKMALT